MSVGVLAFWTGHMIFLLAAGWQQNSCSRIDCSTGLNLACRLWVAQSCLTPVGDIIVFSSLNPVPHFFQHRLPRIEPQLTESLGISKLSTNELSRLPPVLSKEERHLLRTTLLLWGMNSFRSHLLFFSNSQRSLDNELTSHLQRLKFKVISPDKAQNM